MHLIVEQLRLLQLFDGQDWHRAGGRNEAQARRRDDRSDDPGRSGLAWQGTTSVQQGRNAAAASRRYEERAERCSIGQRHLLRGCYESRADYGTKLNDAKDTARVRLALCKVRRSGDHGGTTVEDVPDAGRVLVVCCVRALPCVVQGTLATKPAN